MKKYIIYWEYFHKIKKSSHFTFHKSFFDLIIKLYENN